jgi:endonuclease III
MGQDKAQGSKPSRRRTLADRKALAEAVFSRLSAANPEPKGELEHGNAYQLLVAVVLSAQATDVGVNKATRALFAKVDTPEGMLALGEAGLIERIKTIGLYRAKAKNVIALSKQLVERHGGRVPETREALEALPGVGRKTANVVLNIAFGAPTLAVDTHVFRVSNRIPLAKGATPLEVEQGLLKIVPARFLRHAHHWLILHGRYVCKARKPECWKCGIADLCASREVQVNEGASSPIMGGAAGLDRRQSANSTSAPCRHRRPAFFGGERRGAKGIADARRKGARGWAGFSCATCWLGASAFGCSATF